MRENQQDALHIERFFLQVSLPTLAKISWGAGISLLAIYCVLFILLSPLTVQDLPNHLARADAMSDLLFHGGARFGATYHFQLLWIPYLLGDLLLAGAIGLFGLTGGAAFWVLLVFLSFPGAALFYARVRGIDVNGRALLLLLAAYLATDWFFLIGFLSFRVAVAMLIATLGIVELLRRRWSSALYAGYIAAVVLDYLMHLSPLIFLVPALGVSALLRLRLRTTTVRTEVAFFIPVLVVLAWHFTIASGYREPGDRFESPYLWGTWAGKFERVGSQFFHFTPRADVVLVLLFAASLLTWAGIPRARDLRQPAVLELLALSVTFLAMFFLLPIGYSEAYYVDTRPLPLASFFFVCACLALPQRTPGPHAWRQSGALLLAGLLGVGNIVYLTHHFLVERTWVAQYRSAVAALPYHARVLPVFTYGREGAVTPFLHMSGFLSIDRAAVEPYVFAGQNGNPMKYFRYTRLPYDPPEDWYGKIPRPQLDWRAVARDYDYLLITKPYQPAALGLPTHPVADNSAVTLLAIDK